MFTVDVTLLLRGQDVSMRRSEDKPGPESDRHDDSEETAGKDAELPAVGGNGTQASSDSVRRRGRESESDGSVRVGASESVPTLGHGYRDLAAGTIT